MKEKQAKQSTIRPTETAETKPEPVATSPAESIVLLATRKCRDGIGYEVVELETPADSSALRVLRGATRLNRHHAHERLLMEAKRLFAFEVSRRRAS